MKYIVLAIFSIAIIIIYLYNKPMSDIKKENNNPQEAIVAGGCFWCIETSFQSLEGVSEAISGYTGGHTENPSYEEVSTGATGHYEAVKVIYDGDKLSYADIVDHFFKSIDPTDDTGQFTDKGSQYRTAIFYKTEEEKQIAEKAKADLESSANFNKPIVTQILPASTFYEAEDYHQDYAENSRLRYQLYEQGSGRKAKLKDLWKNYDK